ncbi:MAG TPA: hypothetical protein VGH65_06770 [Verrucomicrobiaceae bacterium]|jgi:hypothetical protein
MKALFIAALVILMTGGAGIAAAPLNAASAKVPTPAPIAASIAGPGDSQSEGALRAFAMACGILAFAAAAQQALSRGRLAGIRVKPARD